MHYRNTIRKLAAAATLVAALSATMTLGAWAQVPAPNAGADGGSTNQKIAIFDQVGIEQKLNSQVPLDLTFTDENGQSVQLGKYFGTRPVILTLVYYQCPMLCSQVLNGMTGALNGITRFNIGRDFDIVTVSFDPRDKSEDALASKKRMISRYRRPGSAEGWHFLTGKEDQIKALAASVGFRYAWDPQIQQFAHASSIMLLTPQGKVAQYYFGIEYAPRDIQLGLVEASQGKIGNVADQLILYCYHYDPARGKYGAVVLNIMRVGALATVLVLGGFVIVMFRRESLAAKQS